MKIDKEAMDSIVQCFIRVHDQKLKELRDSSYSGYTFKEDGEIAVEAALRVVFKVIELERLEFPK